MLWWGTGPLKCPVCGGHSQITDCPPAGLPLPLPPDNGKGILSSQGPSSKTLDHGQHTR